MNTSSALHHIPNRTKKLPPLRVGIGGPVGSGKTTLLEMPVSYTHLRAHET